MTRPKRSASIVSEKKDTSEGVDPAPLRRSTREREHPQQLQATPVTAQSASSKGSRSRRKGRGLPTSSRTAGLDPLAGEAASESVTNSPLASPSTKAGKATKKLVKGTPPLLPPAGTTPLTAVQENGTEIGVHLILNGKIFQPKNRRGGTAVSPAVPPAAVGTAPTERRHKERRSSTSFLGHDGNLYYCVVCSGFGDVVCCDGCPHVYHPECVPLGSVSRQSLENDDDPWYCPECFHKKNPPAKKEGRSEGGRNKRAIKHSCHECQQTRTDLSLDPCKVCGVYIHHPPCVRGTTPSESESRAVVMCSSCRAEAALTEEELELRANKKRKGGNDTEHPDIEATPSKAPASFEEGEKRARKRAPVDTGVEFADVDYHEEEFRAEDAEDHAIPRSGQKRKHPPPDHSTSQGGEPTSEQRKKKKKKKKLRMREAPPEELADDTASSEFAVGPGRSPGGLEESPMSLPGMIPPGPMQGPPTSATPAFHFYLVEMRPKVEKVLMKKHKSFARLPKGSKRNALVAKEAATWWIKLSPVDQKRFIDMSMHDYEARIIAWKEEKNLRAMLTGEAEPEGELAGASVGEKAQDEEMLRFDMHQRLYLATSVGSKPYKPEAGESHNRVLLDLLRDMRFHPLPMFSVSRSAADVAPPDDVEKACMPYFDVHGPISTSVGDECLGCTRGWPHFCPVLQRRMPAVEPRSRLQPPLSSLIASRVGLGLRPRLERSEPVVEEEDEDENRFEDLSELLKWRESKEAADMQKQRFVPCGTLTDPSSRADDIVHFVEEVVAMKIPEPSRPDEPAKQETPIPKKPILARGTLPTRHKRPPDGGGTQDASSDSANAGYEHINKCGRCRTIIMTDLGCVQCRRAQLVINLSKKQPPGSADQKGENKKESKKEITKKEAKKEPEEPEGPLKVQTAMLGRLVTKDNIGEAQTEGDKLISSAILRERWTPCAILPPHEVLAPSPARRPTKKTEEPVESNNVANKRAPPGVVSSEVQAALKKEKERSEHTAPIKPAEPVEPAALTDEQRPRHKKKRNVASPGTFDVDDAERQLAARQYREEADKLHKRTLSIACCGMLVGLLRRDPLLLFAQPVTAEGYANVIKNPIDFGKIRAKVLGDTYQSLGELTKDVKLLCENALIFNPPGSIYWKTAQELSEVLVIMQKRANVWINEMKRSFAAFWRKASSKKKAKTESIGDEAAKDSVDMSLEDPFESLREAWPGAVDMYENSDWLRNMLNADFTRTRENETAFYGSLAVRRAAAAAEECLAPYTDVGGAKSVVPKRTHVQDERLRHLVDNKVAEIIDPVQLKDIATGREETIVRLMRKVQSRRLERRIGSDNGCARCDGMGLDHDMKVVMNADKRWRRSRKKGDGDDNRVAHSRLSLTTGLASANTRERIDKRREQSSEEQSDTINDVCVSLRGSRIHGWGLFAEQPFKNGDVVAEYVGECVSLPVADAREKMYQEMRIQDYQFRLDDSQIIDATMKGGLGRYINHNCNPNCKTKIVPGKAPNEHLRRVLIIAQRDIEPREELSYDYQFPLELDLNARIPCNCQSEICRGFMNWDLPEKGANTGALRTQKRGANMRDRIRRLGRPLKK